MAAARAAARAEAWAAAQDAARAEAGDAAWDAAWDAALYTQIQHICGDLDIGQQHRDYIESRWDVWRKGYAIAYDVDGVLYVYAKENGRG